jgi:hypothetical protein
MHGCARGIPLLAALAAGLLPGAVLTIRESDYGGPLPRPTGALTRLARTTVSLRRDGEDLTLTLRPGVEVRGTLDVAGDASEFEIVDGNERSGVVTGVSLRPLEESGGTRPPPRRRSG